MDGGGRGGGGRWDGGGRSRGGERAAARRGGGEFGGGASGCGVGRHLERGPGHGCRGDRLRPRGRGSPTVGENLTGVTVPRDEDLLTPLPVQPTPPLPPPPPPTPQNHFNPPVPL